MTSEIPVRVTRDHSTGLQEESSVQPMARDRTIILYFRERGADGYDVIATGTAFRGNGLAFCQGTLLRRPDEVRGDIEELLRVWRETVVECCEIVGDGIRAWPYEGMPAQRIADSEALLARVGARLAEAGYVLFDLLFNSGDDDLAALGRRLAAALRADEQIITVISKHLYAPWAMLYVPPDPGTRRAEIGDKWQHDGFLGYRHLVEHSVDARNPVTRITPSGPAPTIGLYANTDLDVPRRTRSGMSEPIVGPIRQALRAMSPTALEEFGSRRELLGSISRTDRTEHITCFVCHGEVGRVGERGPHKPSLIMTDDESVTVSEFESNARRATTLDGSVVLMAVCEGGRLGAFHFDSFPVLFHACGANCVLGPQIDVPVAFAREYTLALIAAFQTPRTRLGDVVRDLARDYLDSHHTPLGLAFALHRGLDTHICYPENPLDA